MLVFPDADGGLLTTQGYKRLWESYIHYLNICAGGRDASRSNPKVVAMEPFTAHQLRHTYATNLYNSDVDLKTAQRLLGHSNINMTIGVYTHLDQLKQAKSIEKYSEFLDNQGIVCPV